MREEKIFEPDTDGSQKEVETNTSEEKVATDQVLDAARAEAADYKDRWMRAQAEFQNYRKRNDRERVEMRATGPHSRNATMLNAAAADVIDASASTLIPSSAASG